MRLPQLVPQTLALIGAQICTHNRSNGDGPTGLRLRQHGQRGKPRKGSQHERKRRFCTQTHTEIVVRHGILARRGTR